MSPLRAALLSGLALALGAGAFAVGTRSDGAVVTGESCLACHANVEGLGSAHDPARIGCSACHLGDPTAREAEGAHAGMVVITGDLASVGSTCGRAECHPSEAARVSTSLMAGSPGILAVNRFAFGERERVEVRREDDFRYLAPGRGTAAEEHAKQLCGSCHLAQPKEERGDLGFSSRGGGCTACHLTSPSGTITGRGALHPGVGADVPERRCEGCHSRSARISLSYRGVAEVEPAQATRTLPDGRPATDTTRDVHAAAGMTCIDCHGERELMGDGNAQPRHASQAVQVRCTTCHDRATPLPPSSADQERVADVLRRSWTSRGLPPLAGRSPLRVADGTPLWRTDAATRTLLLATTGQTRPLTEASAGAHHGLKGHERLSCQACHSEWAPRCTSCHTRRNANGDWEETAGGNAFGPPALALDGAGRIVPFVEGMKLRITGVERDIERELWAPLDPHTTGRSRTCASCHMADARTYPESGDTTRAGARILSGRERERIAAVGACIGCHSSYEDAIYRDFTRSSKRPCPKGRAQAVSRAAPGTDSAALRSRSLAK